NQRSRHGHTCGWTIFRNRSRWNVNVDVMIGKETLTNPQVDGIRPHPGEGRLHRFLHDLANLAGHGEPALSAHDVGFDEQHIASSRRPRQTDSNTGALCALSNLAFTADFDAAEEFLNDFLSNHQLFGFA